MGRKRRRRRSFTREFKAEVLDLCLQGDRPVGQIARDLDLTEAVSGRASTSGRSRLGAKWTQERFADSSIGTADDRHTGLESRHSSFEEPRTPPLSRKNSKRGGMTETQRSSPRHSPPRRRKGSPPAQR